MGLSGHGGSADAPTTRPGAHRGPAQEAHHAGPHHRARLRGHGPRHPPHRIGGRRDRLPPGHHRAALRPRDR
ncbi:hypothetical protein MICRO11B_200085 [Micrococcus luteus]|nr:hypothetical protein MICRO11B_200085 [Micrococcus luteus]